MNICYLTYMLFEMNLEFRVIWMDEKTSFIDVFEDVKWYMINIFVQV